MKLVDPLSAEKPDHCAIGPRAASRVLFIADGQSPAVTVIGQMHRDQIQLTPKEASHEFCHHERRHRDFL
jgi:hypothetical protein